MKRNEVERARANSTHDAVCAPPGGGGGVLLGICGGGVPHGSPNPDPISDQKESFFHTRFQTWPLGRNYVIIT